MGQRWLIISDDLTGGADTGVKFCQNGLKTLLVTYRGGRRIDFAQYAAADALVINTDSRALPPASASALIGELLETYDRAIFPVIYKKIDSTLRGNIGPETDAILRAAKIPLAFLTPALPRQGRILSGGIMTIGGRPLALTEFARDAVSPVTESHIGRLIQRQSSNQVGLIEHADVSSGSVHLTAAIEREQLSGSRIVIFDAVRQSDLARIAEAAMNMADIPLLVGSGGLAEEVARNVSLAGEPGAEPQPRRRGPFKHIFIVSGSASGVTHEQLKRLEKDAGVPCFEMGRSFFLTGGTENPEAGDSFSSRAAAALIAGRCAVKIGPERLPETSPDLSPMHAEIIKRLGSMVISVLKNRELDPKGIALVLTGGETAMGVLNALGVDGVEIEREILDGIVMSRPAGKPWEDLTVVTKAGGFGKEDALEKILEILSA